MEDLELVVVVAHKILLPNQLFVDASNSLNDFRKVNTNEWNAQSLTHVEVPITLNKPSTSMINVNWDAVIDKTHGHIGIDFIVRDHEGAGLAACSTTKIFLVEAAVAEALAAVHTVEFCREIGFFDIMLEGDALQIVNAVKAMGYNWSKMGNLINGIKDGLGKLRSWSIEHVKRDANYAAHFLACETIYSVIDKVLVEEISKCICGIVTNEQ